MAQNGENSEKEALFKLGEVTTGATGAQIKCISIIGQIEGHYALGDNQKATKYEHLIPLLVEAEEDEAILGVLFILNTMGGDVEAGLALAEMIASMKKPTVSLVLGGGHSIGVPLAVAARHSLIVPSATMTLHPVRINGMVIGAPQTYRYFAEMQDRIEDFICDHASIDKARLHTLMMRPDDMATDIGTILAGREAVREGLIDALGGVSQALDYLKSQKQTALRMP